jgi:hypothetical protein
MIDHELHILRGVRHGYDGVRMMGFSDAENFIGECLHDDIHIGEVESDLAELLETCKNTPGL